MSDIAYIPYRGLVLLTEKWPEEKPECDCDVDGAGDFESQQEACARRFKTYNDTVNSCLSTAIDIERKYWDQVEHQRRLDNGNTAIVDLTPYSVDAEFEVREQYRNTVFKDAEWHDYDPKLNGPKDAEPGEFEYRKIARLIKRGTGSLDGQFKRAPNSAHSFTEGAEVPPEYYELEQQFGNVAVPPTFMGHPLSYWAELQSRADNLGSTHLLQQLNTQHLYLKKIREVCIAAKRDPFEQRAAVRVTIALIDEVLKVKA